MAKIEREEREKALKGERNDQLEPEIASQITLQLPMIQYGCPKLMQFSGPVALTEIPPETGKVPENSPKKI